MSQHISKLEAMLVQIRAYSAELSKHYLQGRVTTTDVAYGGSRLVFQRQNLATTIVARLEGAAGHLRNLITEEGMGPEGRPEEPVTAEPAEELPVPVQRHASVGWGFQI